jgi:hypothetical protein
MSLLQTARDHKTLRSSKRYKATEIEELAIAWIEGTISYSQACKALKTSGSGAYGMPGVAIRRAVQSGRIDVKYKI